jgi:hypothetical protein
MFGPPPPPPPPQPRTQTHTRAQPSQPGAAARPADVGRPATCVGTAVSGVAARVRHRIRPEVNRVGDAGAPRRRRLNLLPRRLCGGCRVQARVGRGECGEVVGARVCACARDVGGGGGVKKGGTAARGARRVEARREGERQARRALHAPAAQARPLHWACSSSRNPDATLAAPPHHPQRGCCCCWAALRRRPARPPPPPGRRTSRRWRSRGSWASAGFHQARWRAARVCAGQYTLVGVCGGATNNAENQTKPNKEENWTSNACRWAEPRPLRLRRAVAAAVRFSPATVRTSKIR